MKTVKEIYSSFLGEWRLSRSVYQTLSGERFYADGQAVFCVAPDQESALLYHEDIKMRKEGEDKTFEAYQNYLYCYDAVTNQLTKRFLDGRLFYHLAFSETQAFGDHWCSKDYYTATYDFKSPTQFSLTYFVEGPRENYRMVTQYEKLR